MFPKPERKKDRDLLNTYHTKRCIVCSRQGCDPCHIKSKGSGGDDSEENLISLCRVHHTEQHAKGHYHMATKYKMYANCIESKGWELVDTKLRRKT